MLSITHRTSVNTLSINFPYDGLVMHPDCMEEHAPNLLKWLLDGLNGSSLSFKEGGGKFQLSTLRVNKKNRLLFLVVEGRELLGDIPFNLNRLLVHIEEEHVFGHDYKKTPFFDPQYIRDYITKHQELFSKAIGREALLEWVKAHLPRYNQEGIENQRFPLMPYNRSWIEFTVDQLGVYEAVLPCLHSGPGGAGKTLLQLAHVVRYMEGQPEEAREPKRLQYVTVNEGVVKNMRRNAVGLLDDAPRKGVVVNFLTYEAACRDVLKADEVHADWSFASASDFSVWFKPFYKNQQKLNEASSKKKKGVVVSDELVKKVFEELQWICLRTVYPDLPMGKRRSLFPEESEQADLKEVLSKYESHLISESKIQSEFYFFPAGTASSVDLMCIDEAHGCPVVELNAANKELSIID